MSAPWSYLVEGNENPFGGWVFDQEVIIGPVANLFRLGVSVTRLGEFSKVLAANILAKVDQIFGNFLGSFGTRLLLRLIFAELLWKNCATFYCNTWSRCLGWFLISSPSRWTKLWTTYHCLRRGSSSSRGTRRACGSGLGAIPRRRSSRRRCRRRCRREWAEDEELEAVGRGVGAMASGSRRSEDIRRYRRST